MPLLQQLITLYRGLGRDVPGLLKVSALWLVLQGLASYTLAPFMETNPSDPRQLLLSVGFTLLGLLTLYAVHNYLLEPDAPPRWLPPFKPMGRYVAVMFGVLLFAGLGGVVFAFPFQIVWGLVTQTKGVAGEIVVPELPFYLQLLPTFFMLVLFSRYLLTAPLLLRGVEQPFRLSLRYTAGHMIRLTLLQILAVLPLLLPIVLWSRVGRYDLDGPLLVLLTVFYSLAIVAFLCLYARLMEDEYARRLRAEA